MSNAPNPAYSLQVTLLPAEVITSGVYWQVDGGVPQPSGATVLGLSAGSHTVSFSNVNAGLFTGWTTNGIVASTSNNYTFTLNTNMALAADFSPLYTYTVSASPASGGTVGGGGTNGTGSAITVTATNSSGYIFANWTSNGVVATTSTNFSFTLGANVTLVADFLPLYTVTVSASPANGGTVSPGGTNVSGSAITVTATNSSGYIFANWVSNGVVATTSSNFSFTLSANVTLVADFLPACTVTVIASPANGGTVGGGGVFASNSTVTVTATAANGYVLTNWTQGPGGSVAGTSSNYQFTLTSNVTLVANFVTTPPQIGVFDVFNGATNVLVNGQTTVDFGNIQRNQTGATVRFIVTNSGGQALTLTNITAPPGYALDTNPPLTITNFPFTIAGLGNGTFSVQLTNTDTVGTNSGDIAITNSDTNNPFIIAVTGVVTLDAPLIEVFFNGTNAITNGQTNAVDFGVIQQNQTGTTLTFTVTNSGSQPLDLEAITVPSGYSLTTNSPAIIIAGSNGMFSVQLDTTTLGVNSGTISIANNDTNNNNGLFSFPVTGLVTARIISLSGNLAFGGVAIGSSARGALTISNSGNLPLTVTNISYPAGYGGSNSLGAPIAANGSMNVTVTFSPEAATTYDGVVTVSSDETSGIGAIPISGYGANGSLVLTVLTSGDGTVSPNLNGKTLKQGKKYTLDAVARMT